MTQEKYFELCEVMGSEPIEEEIPIEIYDLPEFVQQCFQIYGLLSDNWDFMGGNYLGKNYGIVFDLFENYNLEKVERVLALDILQIIDRSRADIISEKLKADKAEKATTNTKTPSIRK